MEIPESHLISHSSPPKSLFSHCQILLQFLQSRVPSQYLLSNRIPYQYLLPNTLLSLSLLHHRNFLQFLPHPSSFTISLSIQLIASPYTSLTTSNIQTVIWIQLLLMTLLSMITLTPPSMAIPACLLMTIPTILALICLYISLHPLVYQVRLAQQ